ncbi:hypothetical protein F5Y13DRAFT_184134 [Hypoxylon sp. FL1857]|nr:hypothetical protein F5Y13DRAFT_184134 [Hypoxylon sp. FL1857]
MASRSTSVRHAIPSEDGKNAKGAKDSTSRLGKRKRDDTGDKYFKMGFCEGGSLEVDENDVVKGFHVDPRHWRNRDEYDIPDEDPETPSRPQRASTQKPVSWRSHSEVAMEVAAFKHTVVLHDLVDPGNTHLMVLAKDEAMIQCEIDQMPGMASKVAGLWGFDGKIIYQTFVTVSGSEALEMRRKERQGGLVDGKYKYIPMDWAEADKLMSKNFPAKDDETLVLVQMRLCDKSPRENLKPGRRLVPIPKYHHYRFPKFIAKCGGSDLSKTSFDWL